MPSLPQNFGFDKKWLDRTRVNRSAVVRRCDTLVRRRTVKKQWQATWLVRVLRSIDLTTLAGDDTADYVERLCQKALRPLRDELVNAPALRAVLASESGELPADGLRSDQPIRVAAVCVYPRLVRDAAKLLAGSGVKLAAVATGFPAGQIDLPQKLVEIERAVANGADEIDIVISRPHVLNSDWQALYDEVDAFRGACGAAHMKTILATGELGRLNNVARASLVCMMAGADFIKTSTGKENVNATLPVSLAMVRMIREFYERTGKAVGFKPAGGIKTAKQALQWLALIKEELGDAWLTPERFRFGASSLLGDIERQLEHFVTQRYAAAHRQPMV